MRPFPAGGCGLWFGIDSRWRAARQFDHLTWYCPNGHRQWYPDDNNEDKLRKEVGRLKADRTFWQDEAERRARSLSAVKGQVTRLKNRARAGVCAFCNRHFANVERHCHTKHGYAHDQANCAMCKGVE